MDEPRGELVYLNVTPVTPAKPPEITSLQELFADRYRRLLDWLWRSVAGEPEQEEHAGEVINYPGTEVARPGELNKS